MNIKNLNQKIILKLGIFGAVMGLVTVMGLGQNIEIFLWIFMIISASLLLKKNIYKQIIEHCLLIGLSWGIDCVIIQVLFFDQLKMNNPTYDFSLLNNTPFYPKITLIIFGAIIGLLSGLALWIIHIVIKKI